MCTHVFWQNVIYDSYIMFCQKQFVHITWNLQFYCRKKCRIGYFYCRFGRVRLVSNWVEQSVENYLCLHRTTPRHLPRSSAGRLAIPYVWKVWPWWRWCPGTDSLHLRTEHSSSVVWQRLCWFVSSAACPPGTQDEGICNTCGTQDEGICNTCKFNYEVGKTSCQP